MSTDQPACERFIDEMSDDRPLFRRYADWLGNAATGDFGSTFN
jgi:ABC-type dipeptide/oligopeptide/nickel transport system permease component